MKKHFTLAAAARRLNLSQHTLRKQRQRVRLGLVEVQDQDLPALWDRRVVLLTAESVEAAAAARAAVLRLRKAEE
jgi:hypothetical protein